MGTMCIRGKTLCPTLRGWKSGYWVFHRKRRPRVLPWQQLRRCHSLPFVIPISGAKFEEHCSNISRDIVDWVLYCFSGTIYDVITFVICIIQKRKYLYKKKDITKRKTPFFFTLKNLSNKRRLFVYFIGTLNQLNWNLLSTVKDWKKHLESLWSQQRRQIHSKWITRNKMGVAVGESGCFYLVEPLCNEPQYNEVLV